MMLKAILTRLQYILPQHLLTSFVGFFANSTVPFIKNRFIRTFIKHYRVDMGPALNSNPESYPTFNAFFIRKLKDDARPIDAHPDSIVSPTDGCVAQSGQIQIDLLLQAKGFYFKLQNFLADPALTAYFDSGDYATFYLAPPDYHRVHMPISGELEETIYIPGKLFSVNRMTSELIPNLYSRNERLVCIFKTQIGKVAIVLVGALIVGSIKTVWMNQPIRAKKIIRTKHTNVMLKKGDELGYFALGSTVVILSAKSKISFSLTPSMVVQVGQTIGNIS